MPADKKTVHDAGFAPVPRRIAVAVTLALMAGAGTAWSAGLGRLSVQSALGQPLRAEVEITALNREEAATLSAKLSSPEAFRQSGLEFNAALAALRFAIERRADGRSFVRITSTQPINEPFVDMLLELNWATGRFVREYTFLLDPPELRANRDVVEGGAGQASVVPPAAATRPAESIVVSPAPVPVAPLPRVSAPAVAPVAQAPAAAVQVPAAAPQAPASRTPRPSEPAVPALAAKSVGDAASAGAPDRAKAAAGAAPLERIRVQSGETLGGIAGRIKPAEASLDQTLVSLYQANPQAFIGNINLLKAGAVLVVPSAGEISAVDPAKAREIVLAQSGDFTGYRGRIADTAGQVPASKSGQSAAGTVTAKVEDKSAASKSQDQLKISKSAPVAAAAPGKPPTDTGAAQALAEQAVARDAALKESQSRVKVLEQNVADLKKLLELKNQQFSDLQKQVEAAKVSPTASAAPAAPKIEVPLAKADASAGKPPLDSAAGGGTQADTGKAELPKAESAPKLEAEAKAEPADKSEPVAKAEPDAKAEAAAKAAAAKPAPAAPPADSFLSDLTSNPLMLPGLGAILALGAGYGWYAMRRRRKVEKFADSLIATEGGAANSLFGSTGGHTVDTSTAFASSTRNSGVDVQTTEVDPIAEAEVYIAYGRESQAEEILREALRKQPQRHAIRAKLLEIYSGRKDVASFGALAAEMHDMAAGKNEEWPKVVTMGLAIDPLNPLYTGVVAAAEPAPAEMPVEPPAAAVAPPAAVQPEAFAETVPMALPETERPAAADEAVAPLDFDLNLEPTLAKAGQKLADSRDAAADAPSDLTRAVQGRFDLPDLDLNEPAQPAAQEPTADFGDFDLDLPPSTSGDKTDAAPASPVSLASAEPATELPPIGLDLEMPSSSPAASAADDIRWQEMATKLDLASAYEEIGDKEGARELLDEVVTGGDPAQREKARAMLEKIA